MFAYFIHKGFLLSRVMWVVNEGGYQFTLCGYHKMHKVEKHKEVYLTYS